MLSLLAFGHVNASDSEDILGLLNEFLANAGIESAHAHAPRLDDLTLEDAERLLIRKAMARYDGNVSDAAKGLGLSRSALYRRIEKHGL